MRYAYVGCRTTKERDARGKGLKVYAIDTKTDGWKEIQCLTTLDNPSYQTLDNQGKFLYSVHGDLSKVSSYQIDKDGKITPINTVDIGGKNPVFITVDKTNRYLLVATLQGGEIYTLERNEDGSIGEIVYSVGYEGKRKNQVSCIHQCMWDVNKEYLFGPAQGRTEGYGQLRVFRFHPEDGSLEETDCFRSRENTEPRHLAMHPNNRFAYLVNEKENSVTYFGFDGKHGKMEPRQVLSTLPETYKGEGQASACLVSPSGELLVASNRIHDSLVIYRINQNTGYLATQCFVPCLGKTPRFVCFSPDGSKLYVANEDSDSIIEMEVDEMNGQIYYMRHVIHTESPVCITFLEYME